MNFWGQGSCNDDWNVRIKFVVKHYLQSFFFNSHLCQLNLTCFQLHHRGLQLVFKYWITAAYNL